MIFNLPNKYSSPLKDFVHTMDVELNDKAVMLNINILSFNKDF